MNTSAVMVAMRTKFASPEHAMLTEVANTTGGSATRSADALVMNLWPSRGLTLAGFEVKAYRSDWLKELKDPSKAEAICKFCDFWWVVAAKDDIVKKEEVPLPWGLLVLRGEKLFTVKEAAKLEAQPVSRGFLAALLRRATEQLVPKDDFELRARQRYDAGFQAGRATQDNRPQIEVDRLKNVIKQFETASGVRIDNWQAIKIGEMVKHVVAILPSEGKHYFHRMVEQRRTTLFAEGQALDALIEEYKKLDEQAKERIGAVPLPDPKPEPSAGSPGVPGDNPREPGQDDHRPS